MAVEIEALDADALIEEARRATGLNDFGPDLSFMTGFRNLVEAIEALDPPEKLRASARERILGLLAARLHFADDETRHTAIVTTEVADPLVVCGQPRTGPKIVYDLTCLDPAAPTTPEGDGY